ncbi:MAG: alanine racemase, partial [Verrucomicrobiales bacterium]
MAKTDIPRRCWAEIDLGALVHNAGVAREAGGGSDVMAVIKADAYGHGMVGVGAALESSVDCFGVASVEEGMRLRSAGCKKPVMLLGAVVPDFFPALVEHDLQAMLSSIEEARALSEAAVAAGKIVAVHLMLDTGMGRIGFLNERSLGRLAGLDNL